MKKLKSYNFWVRLASAVILIARIILSKFGYELDSALVIDIATLVAGLLVVLGIINEPTGITISYDETKNNNSSNNSSVKGDNYMTEQIKSDLLERVAKLTDVIKTNSTNDVSSVVQIITGMLDVISNEVDSEVNSKSQNETGGSDVEVRFEHKEGNINNEEYYDKDDENIQLDENNLVNEDERTIDDDPNLDTEDLIDERLDEDALIIGTTNAGQYKVVEYVENAGVEEGMSDIVIADETDKKTASEKLDELILKAEQINPEISVETAFSVLINNPDGLKQLKDYILNSDILSGLSKAQ
ncbi:MAG: hypothetical protein J6J23_02340 [Clostridia bacterium]|nr:hypothetical protein [Clostridia bacterium]